LTASHLNPDFTTCQRIAERINGSIEPGLALALDEGNVEVKIPESYRSSGSVLILFRRLKHLKLSLMPWPE
jgi:flagellar basal body P-ring protein FlgI